jgi:hypothetical protein
VADRAARSSALLRRPERDLDLEGHARCREAEDTAGAAGHGPELDDLAYQAAADALLAITHRLGSSGGEPIHDWGRISSG